MVQLALVTKLFIFFAELSRAEKNRTFSSVLIVNGVGIWLKSSLGIPFGFEVFGGDPLAELIVWGLENSLEFTGENPGFLGLIKSN